MSTINLVSFCAYNQLLTLAFRLELQSFQQKSIQIILFKVNE